MQTPWSLLQISNTNVILSKLSDSTVGITEGPADPFKVGSSRVLGQEIVCRGAKNLSGEAGGGKGERASNVNVQLKPLA